MCLWYGREEGLCFKEGRKISTINTEDELIQHNQRFRLDIYLTKKSFSHFHNQRFRLDYYLTH